jgi:amino acid permease
MIVLVAIVSAFSGFYIAESALADQQHPYLPTLARKHLGTWGFAAMLLGLVVYIYGALVGYLAAGGQIFFTLSHGAIPVWLGTLIYFTVGSVILHRGLVLVSRVNTFLMYGMLVLLGILIGMAAPRIQIPLLLRSSWSSVLDVFGGVLFAYLGHSVIPSIVANLEIKSALRWWYPQALLCRVFFICCGPWSCWVWFQPPLKTGTLFLPLALRVSRPRFRWDSLSEGA